METLKLFFGFVVGFVICTTIVFIIFVVCYVLVLSQGINVLLKLYGV